MPQNRESFESRILTFFQTGDLAAAQLLLGLAAKAVRERLPKKGATPGVAGAAPGAPVQRRRVVTRQTPASEPQAAMTETERDASTAAQSVANAVKRAGDVPDPPAHTGYGPPAIR